MEFTGKFETHITVCLDDLKEIEVLQKWSANNGFKFLHIMLDRGVTASQPMLTRYGWGDLTNELNIAIKLGESLKKKGFSVLRTKIEAAPENQGIPQSNSEALNYPLDRYFEHHIKLLLEPSVDLAQLRKLAEQHSAHLSRNVLKIRNDNYQERFITQRCMTVGRVEAQKRLRILLGAISPLGYSLLKVEQEFVVYDSNLKIDEGWILT